MDENNFIKKIVELIKFGDFNRALEQLNKVKNEDSNVYFLKRSQLGIFQ